MEGGEGGVYESGGLVKEAKGNDNWGEGWGWEVGEGVESELCRCRYPCEPFPGGMRLHMMCMTSSCILNTHFDSDGAVGSTSMSETLL